jgi:hypothetical protein
MRRVLLSTLIFSLSAMQQSSEKKITLYPDLLPSEIMAEVGKFLFYNTSTTNEFKEKLLKIYKASQRAAKQTEMSKRLFTFLYNHYGLDSGDIQFFEKDFKDKIPAFKNKELIIWLDSLKTKLKGEENLRDAVSRHDITHIKKALENQTINVDASNYLGTTALYKVMATNEELFTKAQKIEIAHLLLARGANPNKPNNQRLTPALWAINGNIPELMKKFIEANGDIDGPRTCRGNTLLMYAVLHAHLPIVEMLLEARANPNILNDMNESALIFALFTMRCDDQRFKQELEKIIERLLFYKANANQGRLIVEEIAYSPLGFTKAFLKNNTIEDLLIKYGATKL